MTDAQYRQRTERCKMFRVIGLALAVFMTLIMVQLRYPFEAWAMMYFGIVIATTLVNPWPTREKK